MHTTNETTAPVRDVTAEHLRALKIEEHIDVVAQNGARGTIRRKSRNDFVFRAEHILNRARWGSVKQILDDFTHFSLTGGLPEPKSYGF